jgi:hypothetical protein
MSIVRGLATIDRPFSQAYEFPHRRAPSEASMRVVLNSLSLAGLTGDLNEEYATRILPRLGKARADMWYRKQVVMCILPIVFRYVRRLAAADFVGYIKKGTAPANSP